jgi:hypothetical protein
MFKRKYFYCIFTLQEAIFLASYSAGRQKWQCEQRKRHIYGVNVDERKEGEEEEEARSIVIFVCCCCAANSVRRGAAFRGASEEDAGLLHAGKV